MTVSALAQLGNKGAKAVNQNQEDCPAKVEPDKTGCALVHADPFAFDLSIVELRTEDSAEIDRGSGWYGQTRKEMEERQMGNQNQDGKGATTKSQESFQLLLEQWDIVKEKYPDQKKLGELLEALIPTMPANANGDLWYRLALRLASTGSFEKVLTLDNKGIFFLPKEERSAMIRSFKKALDCARKGVALDPNNKSLKQLEFSLDERITNLEVNKDTGCLGLVLLTIALPLMYLLMG